MELIEKEQPSSGTSKIVPAKLVIAETCKMLRAKDPATVGAQYKDTAFWKKYIGITGYLLEKDARIPRPGIAKLLECRLDVMANEILNIRTKEASGDVEIVGRLAKLRAIFNSNGYASGSASTPKEESETGARKITTEMILRAVGNASGLSITALIGSSTAFIAIVARDVAFVFLTHIGMSKEDAAKRLHRVLSDITHGLRRMRDLDATRRQVLLDAAKELGIGPDEALSLAEGD